MVTSLAFSLYGCSSSSPAGAGASDDGGAEDATSGDASTSAPDTSTEAASIGDSAPDIDAGAAVSDAGGDTSTLDASTDGSPDASTADASADAKMDALPNPEAGSDATASVLPDAALDSSADSAADAPFDGASEASSVAVDAAFGPTGNLLVNGNAEAAAGSNDGSVVATSIPGWTTTGEANVLTYGAAGGYPATTDPGPTDRGLNFFAGGPDDTTSTFTQTVDLSAYETAIALGHVTLTVSGYLGGYSSQDDNAVLTITFLGGLVTDGGLAADGGPANVTLGTASIGPVLAADRGSVTGLIFKTATAAVPVGTTSVEAELVMTRLEGTANDGYADNLSVTLAGM